MADDEAHAVAPFRHRHDGWTRDRQKRFLERLTETGCVSEACRAVGLSTTSAYRAYARMPDFGCAWDVALRARRPMLEDAAFMRAIHGITIPLTRLGQVVGERRVFSNGLLRFLIEREDRRHKESGGEWRTATATRATAEETDRVLNKRLDQIARQLGQDRSAIGIANERAAEEARRNAAPGANFPSVRVCTGTPNVPKIDVDS